jgi:putative aldouronate transport system substrate-binding protein
MMLGKVFKIKKEDPIMKRTLIILMVIIMLITLILPGCGGAGDKDATQIDKTAPGGEKSASEDDEELGVAYSWQKDTSPVTFTTFIDYDWYALDTWGNDQVSQEITRRTGVSLDVIKSSDRTQLQVLLAGDELPEIVFTDHLVERFHTPDLCYPWDELIEEHCPEFLDQIDPIEIINNTAADGHFYTLKSHFSDDAQWEDPRNLPSPGTAGFYVRQDILDELGNPPLEELDDLLDIFRMVKENYPDMVVYIPHPTWASPIQQWMGLMSATSPYVDGDKVYYGLSQPGLVEYYKLYNRLIREGYVNIESLTYEPEQFFQIVRSGQAFSASYNSGLADDCNRVFQEQGIDGWFVPILNPLKVDGELKYKLYQWSVGWSSCFITKKCKNPGRAIRYMQFLKSPEGDQLTQWGIEGVHYTLTEDGLLKRPEGFDQLTTQEHGIGPWYFQASGLGEGVVVSSAKINRPEFSQNVDLLRALKPHVIRDFAMNFVNPQPETEEMNILVKLNDLVTNSQPDILTSASEEEVELKFNELLKNAEAIGVRELEAYMTDAYAKAKQRYEGIK